MRAFCSGRVCEVQDVGYKWKLYIVVDSNIYREIEKEHSHSCMDRDQNVLHSFTTLHKIDWEEDEPVLSVEERPIENIENEGTEPMMSDGQSEDSQNGK